jgi:hypothetical protein
MTLDEVVAILVEKHPVERSITTEAKDVTGRQIHTGDVITFWSRAAEDGGEQLGEYSAEKLPGSAKMHDVVLSLDGRIYAFDLDTLRGCFIHRVAGKCTVVGSIYEDASELQHLARFSNPLVWLLHSAMRGG